LRLLTTVEPPIFGWVKALFMENDIMTFKKMTDSIEKILKGLEINEKDIEITQRQEYVTYTTLSGFFSKRQSSQQALTIVIPFREERNRDLLYDYFLYYLGDWQALDYKACNHFYYRRVIQKKTTTSRYYVYIALGGKDIHTDFMHSFSDIATKEKINEYKKLLPKKESTQEDMTEKTLLKKPLLKENFFANKLPGHQKDKTRNIEQYEKGSVCCNIL